MSPREWSTFVCRGGCQLTTLPDLHFLLRAERRGIKSDAERNRVRSKVQINWQWMAAAITIGLLCFLAVWVPFWLGGLDG